MANCRFIYENRITSEGMIAVSSSPDGMVGTANKIGGGSAAAYFRGPYTGDADDKYEVKIVSVDAGAEVGEATFRWRKQSSGTWQSETTTSESWLTLDNGVQVRFVSGEGDDFEVAATFSCLAVVERGKANLLDNDRDTSWRSTGVASENITIDLGAAAQVTALCLLDHNLTSGATLTLKADATGADWGSPDWSDSVTWRSGIIILWLDQTYRYWRLEISDAGNSDGHVEIGGLILAGHFEPSKQFNLGNKTETAAQVAEAKSPAGLNRPVPKGRVKAWSIRFKGLDSDDVDDFDAWHNQVYDEAAGVARPFVFVPYVNSLDRAVFCLPPKQLSWQEDHTDSFSLSLVLTEVAKSA